MNALKVSSKSNPNLVAGAIAGAIRECGRTEVQAVGAGATNQAVKAIAIANGFLSSSDVQLVCQPSFMEIEMEGAERTAIRIFVKAVPATPAFFAEE